MRLLALATRNLLRSRRRTAIALAALVVGVGAMVVLRGLVNGQQRIILENIVLGQLGAVQVHREGYLANVQGSPLSLDMEDSEALRQRIAAVPGVIGVSPRLAFGGMVSMPEPEGADDSEPRTTFLQVLAFDPALEPRVTPKRMTWVGQGAFLSEVGAPDFSGLVSNGVSQTTFVGRGVDPAREKQAVRKSDGLPVKAQCFGTSGQMLRSAEFSDFTEFEKGYVRPAKVVMRNELVKSRRSELVVKSLKRGVDAPAQRFTQADLGR